MKDIKIHDEGHQGSWWRTSERMSESAKFTIYVQRMNAIKNFCMAIDSLIFVDVEGLYIPRVTRVSVPSSELAPPAPGPPRTCVRHPPPPPVTKGHNTRLQAREPVRTTGEKAWHSVGVTSGFDLEVSVDEVIDLKILVVVSERV